MLPLGVAAERSVHYFWDYFFLSSMPHTFLPEGGYPRVEILHGVLSHKKIRIWGGKKIVIF